MTKQKPKGEAGKVFYDALVNDPDVIISWCKREIKAYKELIAIIKNERKKP